MRCCNDCASDRVLFNKYKRESLSELLIKQGKLTKIKLFLSAAIQEKYHNGNNTKKTDKKRA